MISYMNRNINGDLWLQGFRYIFMQKDLPYTIGFTQELETAKMNSARWILGSIFIADALKKRICLFMKYGKIPHSARWTVTINS